MSDNNTDQTKKRGRKKGSMRPIYFIGVSSTGEVKEFKQVPTAASPLSKPTAEASLKKLLGADCKILGPYYEVMGAKDETEREMIIVSVKDITYTSNKFEGEYQGWKFFGNGLGSCSVDGEDFDDDDLIHGQFDARVDSASKIPKPRLMRNAMIRRSLVDKIAQV